MHIQTHFYDTNPCKTKCLKCTNAVNISKHAAYVICAAHLVISSQFYIINVNNQFVLDNDCIANELPIFQLGLVFLNNKYSMKNEDMYEAYHITFMCAPNLKKFNDNFGDALFNAMNSGKVLINGEPDFKKKIKDKHLRFVPTDTILLNIFVCGIATMNNLQNVLNNLFRHGNMHDSVKKAYAGCLEYFENNIKHENMPSHIVNNLKIFFSS